MWAQGRAKRREEQRLRAELDVQTSAEIFSSQRLSAHGRVQYADLWAFLGCSRQSNSKQASSVPLLPVACDYLHVGVEFGDPALCYVPLVSDENLP